MLKTDVSHLLALLERKYNLAAGGLRLPITRLAKTTYFTTMKENLLLRYFPILISVLMWKM